MCTCHSTTALASHTRRLSSPCCSFAMSLQIVSTVVATVLVTPLTLLWKACSSPALGTLRAVGLQPRPSFPPYEADMSRRVVIVTGANTGKSSVRRAQHPILHGCVLRGTHRTIPGVFVPVPDTRYLVFFKFCMHALLLILLPLRTPVPFWGQTTYN